MSEWLLKQFPSGEWSVGWVMLVVLCGMAALLICIALNIKDGRKRKGKTND